MSDTIETLRLDETHRVLVKADDSPTCPRGDWEMATGALTVRGDSRTMDVPALYGFPGNLRDADERLYGLRRPSGWGAEDAVIRWARIFHDIELEYVDGTYWWVDPTKFANEWKPVGTFHGTPLYTFDAAHRLITAAEAQHHIIEGERATYQQWAAGEVYGLVIEELKVEGAKIGVDDDGNPVIVNVDELDFDDWEEIEAVWGFYLDLSDDDEVIREAKGLY